MTNFNELNLIKPLTDAVISEGYTTPTPIQAKAIPIILENHDLLGVAQTGTGKTAAFSIPILQLLENNKRPQKGRKVIRTLIVTPTRELAIQIGSSLDTYGKFLKLKNTVIFGGVKQGKQADALHNGVDILVATPGRLLDLINQNLINLSHLEIFVLDEADRMLDMGFIHDIKKLLAYLPKKRQSLFFSATMPPDIQKLSESILVNPQRIEITPVASTADTITQKMFYVDKPNKSSLLIHLLKELGTDPVLVFTRTKHGADKVVKILLKNNIKADAIHGDKAQNARQRALENFKSGISRVLVATDIAARGIDIDSLAYVINFDIPNIAENYVHRIGRTGRAGANGTSFSFCDQEEKSDLKDILKLINRTIEVVEDHPFPASAPAQNQVAQNKKENDSKPSGSKPKKKKKFWKRNKNVAV